MSVCLLKHLATLEELQITTWDDGFLNWGMKIRCVQLSANDFD